MIRVLVADDQALVRGSFRLLVDTAPDLEVIGEAATGAEAVEIATSARPDVLLMDIRMPVMDGIEATRQITGSPQTADGDALLAPAVTRRLIAEFARLPQPGQQPAMTLEGITERECEVLTLIARGLSNAEIAGTLHVTMATAKTHVGRLLAKLGARDRAQLVVVAYETGLVRPG